MSLKRIKKKNGQVMFAIFFEKKGVFLFLFLCILVIKVEWKVVS